MTKPQERLRLGPLILGPFRHKFEKEGITIMRFPNRVLQSCNPDPKFRVIPRVIFGTPLPTVLSIPNLVSLLLQIPNSELQMSEIFDPEKPIGDPQ